MFNLFKKKPVIQLAHYEEGTVFFTTESPLTQGQVVKVMARLPEGEQFVARLTVGDYDPNYAHWSGTLEGTEHNPAFLPKALPPRENRRRAPRISVTVGILSPQVPGYRAITADLSVSGACLVLDAPLNPGTPMRLELDLDAPGTSRLQIDAESRWCMENAKTGKFLTGAQFVNMTPQIHKMLERYVHHVEDQRPT